MVLDEFHKLVVIYQKRKKNQQRQTVNSSSKICLS